MPKLDDHIGLEEVLELGFPNKAAYEKILEWIDKTVALKVKEQISEMCKKCIDSMQIAQKNYETKISAAKWLMVLLAAMGLTMFVVSYFKSGTIDANLWKILYGDFAVMAGCLAAIFGIKPKIMIDK